METTEGVLTVRFGHSGEKREVSVAGLAAAIVDFLDHYDTRILLGEAFCKIIGKGGGAKKWARLLDAAGHAGNAEGFCRELLARLEPAGCGTGHRFRINGVEIPHLLVVAVLEMILPGDRFTSVRSVERLERLSNRCIPAEQRDDLQKVLDTYPVRLSTHTIRQACSSRNVAYQYLPFVEELDPAGHVNTWIGQFHDGLLERMYQNRVIFLLNMTCPVYCRFCFRKHKESRNQPNPTTDDVLKAVEYVRRSPSVKEIVITGGDPLMNRKNLECAVDGLMSVPHVQTLRMATRSISYYPSLFTAGNGSLLKYLKAKSLELQRRGKRLEIATHFIHPDEISIASLELITDFTRNGIAVYVQTPFLRDCNDTGPELVRLFSLLRGAGAELHYIYIPCSAIQGNAIYWTPISKGIAVAEYLRANLSDRVIPRICTATPIGKMEWNTSGWAVEQDREDENFIWIRTAYSPDYFKQFAPLADGLDNLRVNDEGTIDVHFRARIGDDSLILGPRPKAAEGPEAPPPAIPGDLAHWQEASARDQRLTHSIVATGNPGIFRHHKTRVEVDLQNYGGDLSYIRNNDAITDVVLSHAEDALGHLHEVEKVVWDLRGMPHVSAVRLRSFAFTYDPTRFTPGVIDRLGGLNRLTVVRPLRLEIETRFLHPSEIVPAHDTLAAALRARGITVYGNIPLLAGINAFPQTVSQMAYALRSAGIEVHHVFVAGLPIQVERGVTHPVCVSQVIDIAGRVRRDGSGREIPEYIIHTALGEVDFGMTSKLLRENDRLTVRLAPYRLSYYREMDAGFSWPQGVREEASGVPVIPVAGLSDDEGFMVYAP